ncbi:echinoidin-like [Lissotriton helveticus]
MKIFGILLLFSIIEVIADAQETCLCAQGNCETGWVQYKNACYMRFDSMVSWTAAETACLAINSHLASIHSNEENDFVYTLMGKPNNPPNGASYWIGAHDSFQEGNFMFTDGSKMNVKLFGVGEPNNYKNDEDCVGIGTVQNGHITWNDFPLAGVAFPYVCKYYLSNRLCGTD